MLLSCHNGSTSANHVIHDHLLLLRVFTLSLVVEVMFLHFGLHRFTSLILLHVKHLVDVCQEVCIVIFCSLPIDPLTELLNRTAFLQI